MVLEGGRELMWPTLPVCILACWYGGLLEPAVETAGRSYVEFIVDYAGSGETAWQIGFGVVPLETPAPAGWSAAYAGWVYYCGNGAMWSGPTLSSTLLPAGSCECGTRVGLLVESGR